MSASWGGRTSSQDFECNDCSIRASSPSAGPTCPLNPRTTCSCCRSSGLWLVTRCQRTASSTTVVRAVFCHHVRLGADRSLGKNSDATCDRTRGKSRQGSHAGIRRGVAHWVLGCCARPEVAGGHRGRTSLPSGEEGVAEGLPPVPRSQSHRGQCWSLARKFDQFEVGLAVAVTNALTLGKINRRFL